MKILLDGRLLSEKPTGISRYSEEIIKIYQNYFGKENIDVLVKKNYKNENFNCIETSLSPFNIIHFLLLSFILKKYNYEIYHSLYYSNTFFKMKKVKYIITVHDLMYRKVKNFFGKNKLKNYIGIKYYDFIVKKSLKNSDTIISVSETTKKDLLDAFNKVSIFIPEGVNKIEVEDKAIESLKNKNFYLYVGNSRPHKNLDFLINCFEKAEINKRLVLVGTGNNYVVNNPKIDSLKFVTDGQLSWLYKNCTAFIFPSIYEGFGLPILEALNKGAKVYSSNGGALKEFPQNVIKYFDPYKELELIELLKNEKNEENNMEEIEKILKTYDWKNTEKHMLKIFKTQ